MPEPFRRAADHQDAGIDEADQADEHPTETAGGVADQDLRGRVAGGRGRGDVRHGERARLGQPGRERRGTARTGDRQRRPHQPLITAVRLKAAGLTAAADRPVLVERQVRDVTRGACRSAMQRAAEDQPAADRRAELQVEKIVERTPDAGVLLAEGEHVGVVVDKCRAAQCGGEGVADGEALPTGQRRRRDGCAAVDRSGQGDPDAGEFGDAQIGAELLDQFDRSGDHRFGPAAGVHHRTRLGQRAQLAVGHRNAYPVRCDDHAGEADPAREAQQRRTAPTARGRRSGGLDQSTRDEPVQFGGERRPGQARDVAHLHT
ncbi:hypothetical protein Jiend_42940 [Micromonospora endophytica]|nr:hypothetical protein Jiend_42940 [Micromonospora endophytica]